MCNQNLLESVQAAVNLPLGSLSSTIHHLGQVVGVDPKVAWGAWETRVTSPLSLNTQPVAGIISTASEALLIDVVRRGSTFLPTVVEVSRVSDHTTSLLRGSSGLGGNPPRPVTDIGTNVTIFCGDSDDKGEVNRDVATITACWGITRSSRDLTTST